jgi:cyclic pyranopterin phosphate synthase
MMNDEWKTTDRRPLPLTTEGPRGSGLDSSFIIQNSSFLTDRFNRKHTNLRVSVTDRCNLRCTYCMPEDVTFRPRAELLTFEEVAAFVRVAAGLGVDKVRLTGGEPLLRRDLPDLVRMIAAVPGIADVGLTTNGLLLDRFAAALKAAGLRRLNVSLDTLDPGRFRALARRDGVEQVITGLMAAKAAGFAPVKVNAVAVRGFVERDAVPLARFCRDHGFELRFIEYMPIGADPWERDKVVSATELLGRLRREVCELVPASGADPHAPATDWDYADGGGRVGVIPSVSAPFCGTCNRLRLTADGKLRNCLFALDETDVKPLLRPAADAAGVADALRASVGAKWAGHGFNAAGYVKPGRTMHAIGG